MRLLLGLVCLLLAGCGGGGRGGGGGAGRPVASAAPAVSGPGSAPDLSGPAPVRPSDTLPGRSLPSVIEPGADDPPGSIACARLVAAMDAGSFMTPGVVDRIVAASATADAPLADAAHRLGVAYRAAVASKNKPDEPDRIGAVAAAASDMSGVCAASGLRTVG
jgi:hypothetical protein